MMQNITEKLIFIGFSAATALIAIAIFKIILNLITWYKMTKTEEYKFLHYQKLADEAIAKGLLKSFGYIVIGIVLLWLFW